MYEERITLWMARDFDEAIARAEEDAREYADEIGLSYLGLAQCYLVAETPGDGAEVFSLIRDSDLAPQDYVTKYFDTGREHQQAE